MASASAARNVSYGPLIVRTPPAYKLAAARRRNFRKSYSELQTRLKHDGCGAQLIEFVSFVKSGQASINMSVASCVRFLETGVWLNVFEAIRKETGATGKLLEAKVRRRLRYWYVRRRAIERLLCFQRDTHYSALNLGGPGASRYGPCCVLLRTTHEHKFATAFAGDSLRALFDASGKRVLNDDEGLSLFSVRDDASRLAAIRCRHEIAASRPGVDPLRLRGLLENSDSLIEIHLHGPVRRAHIEAVLMARSDLAHFWDLAQRAESVRPPSPQEFDVVPFFLRLIELLRAHRIPLQIAESA